MKAAFAAVILVALALAGCGGGQPQSASPSDQSAGRGVSTEGTQVAAGLPAQSADDTASEFLFDPKTITVRAGEVTFHIKNGGSIVHTFTSVTQWEGQPSGLFDTGDIQPGATTTIAATLAPGTYYFECTIPGHAQAGMTGTLTVE